MANQVYEAVRTVIAVREYQDKDVPDEVLRRVVEAAHLTASGSNAQPWHFILVRERAGLRKLGSLIRTGPYVGGAAAAVLVADEKKNSFAGSDARPAVQSIVLARWGEGVGSNWAGGGGGA